MPGADGLCRDAKAGRGRMPLTRGCFEGLRSAQSEGSLLVQQCGLQLGGSGLPGTHQDVSAGQNKVLMERRQQQDSENPC